ncbi:dynamin family protein [Paenibacillus sp. LjRoot153]|uniref:dynamin family protein n=1 Tax=Paenibacillus sp. LjRoot153 TaxID=3342270 RepID=UPI003ECF1830
MIPNILEELQQISQKVKQPTASLLIDAVSGSLLRNTFHIAVLGEFKRGKTTFVNSLIGNNLLFTDVLPATAFIHVLEYSENERIEIWYTDGRQEQLTLCKEHLAALSANHNIEPESIKFVKIYVDHPLLRDGVVIIDTPGVNDLVSSRAEITANILPHCDAALFLLDAVAPLTRSEAEFLEAKVYYNKLDQILFILSKSDRLDEDELQEAIEGAELRVKNVTGKNLSVHPYSAKSVLQQVAAGEMGLTPQLQRVYEYISKLREDSRVLRDERNGQKLLLASDLLVEHVEWQQSIHQANEEQWRKLADQLDVLIQEMSVKFARLLTSIEKIGRSALQEMVSISYTKFKDSSINDLRYDIRSRQSNLEKMLEREIPLYMEQQLRRFSEVKASEIQIFIEKLQIHISEEYQKHFRLPLTQVVAQSGIPIPSWVASISPHEQNQVQQVIKQVAPFTVGATVGTVIFPGIGTIIGGAVGMAYNVFAKNKKLEQLRDELLQNLEVAVGDIVDTHHKETSMAIDVWFDHMLIAFKEYHNEQYDSLVQMIQSKQQAPNLQSVELELSALLQLRERLTAIRGQLSHTIPITN